MEKQSKNPLRKLLKGSLLAIIGAGALFQAGCSTCKNLNVTLGPIPPEKNYTQFSNVYSQDKIENSTYLLKVDF